jgi:cytochrome c biogenesis protein CcdA
MSEFVIAVATAVWLGFLTSISPCPLATNIAAVSFVGRRVGRVGLVLSAGLLYTLGRTLTYAVLGMLLVGGLLAAPQLSHVLQKYMNLFMGPLLILVAMVLLKMIAFKTGSGTAMTAAMRSRIEKMGVWGALPLGIFFALSFCPTSAALFFGSLLPLAVKFDSGVLLPGAYGVATGLPVLLFAFLLAFAANQVGRAYDKLARFEAAAQRVTGLIFLTIGVFMTITITLGVKIW